MKRQDLTQGMHIDTTADIIAPELLTRFRVQNHPALPITVSIEQTWLEDDPRIRAVGVGPLGAEMVQILSRNLAVITCHEVIFNPKGEGSEEMTALLSLVRESDLLFILTGLDDEPFLAAARAVGHAAREVGILTIAIIPDDENISQQAIAELTKDADAVFPVSERSLSDKQDLTLERIDALTGNSMRHMVRVLTDLICYRSPISIDFTDIQTTLRNGSSGRLGVGTASGQDKACRAVKLALARLESQGLSSFDATEVVVIVQGSAQCLDDYEDVGRVINDNVLPETGLLVGLVADELLGFSDEIKVTVMAAR
jgi:cell division protein FtsZ